MNPANTPAPMTPGSALPAARFGRLNPLGPVGLNGSACLHLHKSWVACTRCKEACPNACLQLEAGTVRLDASRCTACGRCAVACPTDALAVEGFALDQLLVQRAGATLTIGCREPVSDRANLALVPCLAGLSARSLLGLLEQHPESRIELVEATDCPGCRCEKGSHSVAHRLAAAVQALLVDCHLPSGRIGVVTGRQLLPDSNVVKVTQAPPSGGRRSFFAGLGRAVSQTVIRQASGVSPLVDPATLPKQPRNAVPYTGGHQTRLLMQRLAGQAGQAPARAPLARISVSGNCCAAAPCSRLCPTGALSSSRDDGVQTLSFDTWLCIDCAACRTACTEKVLHYEAPASRPFAAAPALLSRLMLTECSRCNERYSPADESALCPVCRKSASLSQAGFALFAGLRNHVPAETGPP